MRKKLRDRFEDCYTVVPVPADNDRGFKMKYIYYAPWYIWDLPEGRLRLRKAEIVLAGLIGLAAGLFAMTRESVLNRTPAVFALNALVLCCHVMETAGLLPFAAARYRTTKMTYEDADRLLTVMPPARAFLTGALAVLCVVHAFRHGSPVSASMAVAFVLSAAAGLWLQWRYRSIPLRTEENDSLEKYEKQMEEKSL